MPNSDFYYRFENAFRGSEEHIKQRLRVYEPLLRTLSEIHPSASCVDLGCGRGEWLTLLEERGFEATGVDTDSFMIETCEENGRRVKQRDALEYLTELPPESQAIISGFHIAEHLDFDVLAEIFSEAHRALKAGGLLILETPNPENIVVSSLHFYMDPTHRHPLPPDLMSFLANEFKFSRSDIWRLNHHPNVLSGERFTLGHVLGGVSPDYALIAQKYAEPEILDTFDPAFSCPPGLELSGALQKYESELANQSNALAKRISAAEEKASAAEEKASAAEDKASAAENKASAAEDKASAAEDKASAAEDKASAAESLANSAESARELAEAQLLAIQKSASWRLTYPMRLLVSILIIRPTNAGRRVANRLLAGLINALETPLANLMKFFLRYPRITALADKSLSRLPFLRSHLMEILWKSGTNRCGTEIATTSEEQSHSHLSPRARQIHADLKAAIKSNR